MQAGIQPCKQSILYLKQLSGIPSISENPVGASAETAAPTKITFFRMFCSYCQPCRRSSIPARTAFPAKRVGCMGAVHCRINWDASYPGYEKGNLLRTMISLISLRPKLVQTSVHHPQGNDTFFACWNRYPRNPEALMCKNRGFFYIRFVFLRFLYTPPACWQDIWSIPKSRIFYV